MRAATATHNQPRTAGVLTPTTLSPGDSPTLDNVADADTDAPDEDGEPLSPEEARARHHEQLIAALSETIGQKRSEISALHNEIDKWQGSASEFKEKVNRLSRELAWLQKQKGSNWRTMAQRWIKSLLGKQSYEIKDSGGWCDLQGADSDDADGLPEDSQFEVRCQRTGDEVVLQPVGSAALARSLPTTAVAARDELRLQYRKAGTSTYTTIGVATVSKPLNTKGYTPQQLLGEDRRHDGMYGGHDAETPPVPADLRMVPRGGEGVRRRLNFDLESEYSTTSQEVPQLPLRIRQQRLASSPTLSDVSSTCSEWTTATERDSDSSLCRTPKRSPPANRRLRKASSDIEGRSMPVDGRSRMATTRTPSQSVSGRPSHTGPGAYTSSGQKRRSKKHQKKDMATSGDSGFLSASEYVATTVHGASRSSRPLGLADMWDRAETPLATDTDAESMFGAETLRNGVSPTTPTPAKAHDAMMPTTPSVRKQRVPAWREAVLREQETKKAAARRQIHPVLGRSGNKKHAKTTSHKRRGGAMQRYF
eukprot:m.83941 g.83941  ORF g.83941 m.83941 type:complete len:536 (+) comp9572_c0_seq1:166-1773(+)